MEKGFLRTGKTELGFECSDNKTVEEKEAANEREKSLEKCYARNGQCAESQCFIVLSIAL